MFKQEQNTAEYSREYYDGKRKIWRIRAEWSVALFDLDSWAVDPESKQNERCQLELV